MKKLVNGIDFLIKAVLIVMVASFIVIVFAQVIARYVFNNSLTWSEELARVLFTQMIFLAIPLVVYEKHVIAVDILTQFLKVKTKRYLYVVINALSFVFFAFLTVSGYRLAMANMNQFTTALHLCVGRLNMIIPISGVLMMINVIRSGYNDFTVTYAEEKKEEVSV